MKIKWCTVDEKFLNYLRKHEQRIPYSDYGKYKIKPFFGKLFETDELIYITQVSHPDKRHYKMKDNTDFIKLFDKNKQLIAVVNLNFMFPVLKSELIPLKYENIDEFRAFKHEDERWKYISLLKKELKIIKDTPKIVINANKLYRLKIERPKSRVSKRCLEFKYLESLCFKYEKN